jgi:Heparinase II/III-like protein/Heparinase II/III N-terminus
VTRPFLYLQALRVARARQLRARVVRPIARRRFPSGLPLHDAGPVPAAKELWRSPAFGQAPVPDPATRLSRFHRHYGEDVLAAARGGDPATARRLVTAWIDANPPHPGDAWHPYPLSTRVGNWIAALTLEPELGSPILSESLWRQLRHLDRDVEDDVLGNHVIRNARALVLGGVAFGDGRLLERGLALLRREVPEQVLPDGGHYERAPAYHSVVLRDLLEVQAAAPQQWLGEPIERMRTYAAALQRPDGEPALFNDGWLGLGPTLDLPEPPQGLTVLRDSGFAVVREGPMWLAFRCGLLAPDFLPAHAHADALSFQLWWRGEPVVVDAGTYTYEPGPDRDWFRSTAAHSTVCVDGRNQFELWGAFRSGPLPRVELHEVRDGVLEASVTLCGGVRHVRRIDWTRDEVRVRDRIEGRGRHELESRVVWAGAEPLLQMEALGEVSPAVEQRWVSERLGERVSVAVSVLCSSGDLPVDAGFVIRLV